MLVKSRQPDLKFVERLPSLFDALTVAVQVGVAEISLKLSQPGLGCRDFTFQILDLAVRKQSLASRSHSSWELQSP